jgi:hypothetical protein
MTHAIKGFNSVTHNTRNEVFVIPCFINRITHLSPLEAVQSQNNAVDGLALHTVQSVAASPQQVSLFLAQPEHLEQGQRRLKVLLK